MIGGIAVVAEALRLAGALGLDPDTARTALANGPLGAVVARAFAGGVHFDTALAVKDLELAVKTTRLPAVEAALAQYRDVCADPALAHADLARAVAHLIARD
ncbi:hypothetical protein [Streptomyces sp. NPDC001480]|uniref:hypothetical protein n=1 Tax=Streptomyces sp. NPDC001480 TaxID=3364577 RepID=UPI003695F117